MSWLPPAVALHGQKAGGAELMLKGDGGSREDPPGVTVSPPREDSAAKGVAEEPWSRP